MKKLLSKIVFGKMPLKEYCTVTIEDKIKEKVYLHSGNSYTEITECQWLLCLNPVVFGIWLNNEELHILQHKETDCTIYFTPKACDVKDVKKQSSAMVALSCINTVSEKEGSLFLLKAVQCKLFHINLFKTRLLFASFYKKPAWPFKKYKSLIAAYSYPRKVGLISYREKEYFNIFPMDLLGAIPGTNFYVFGLRHTNASLAKIIDTGKMVLSEISFNHKAEIYELGKHHGAAPPAVETLPFGLNKSKAFNFYIPEWAQSYKEIIIKQTLDLGSHRLLFGELVNEEKLLQPGSSLYHIHFLQFLFQQQLGYQHKEV